MLQIHHDRNALPPSHMAYATHLQHRPGLTFPSKQRRGGFNELLRCCGNTFFFFSFLLFSCLFFFLPSPPFSKKAWRTCSHPDKELCYQTFHSPRKLQLSRPLLREPLSTRINWNNEYVYAGTSAGLNAAISCIPWMRKLKRPAKNKSREKRRPWTRFKLY